MLRHTPPRLTAAGPGSTFFWKKDRFAEYMNTGPGAGPKSTVRPHLTDPQAASQEVSDWLGNWTP